MRNLKVLFTMMTICWTVVLMVSLTANGTATTEPTCPGRCINEGPNKNHDLLCQQAREYEGKIGCNKMKHLGCVYYERTEIVQPGYCLNEGLNQQNDLVCKESGENLCEKLSSLGCLWHSARHICR